MHYTFNYNGFFIGSVLSKRQFHKNILVTGAAIMMAHIPVLACPPAEQQTPDLLMQAAEVRPMSSEMAASGIEDQAALSRTVRMPAYTERRNYTVEDGLLSNSIYGIVQDSLGFIWFGTDNGLCRFDGNEFMSYTYDEARPSGSISSNNIRRLMMDSRGRIWISLDNGVDIYDPFEGMFSHFSGMTEDGVKVTGQTIEIIEDRDGEIWIATVNQGLFRWNPDTEKLSVYRHDPTDASSIAQDYISILYESSDGTIWVGTYSEGLDAFSKNSGKFVHYRKSEGGISDNSIDAITEDSYGNIWIGTVSSGLDRLERATSTVTNFKDTDGGQYLQRIHYLEEIRPGELLVCSHSGARLYRISEDGIRSAAGSGSHFTMSDCGMVYSFLKDREGNFWFGSMYDGVEFRPVRNNFICYSMPDDSAGRTSMSSICGLGNGRYLLGTWNNGIMLFNEDSGTISPYVRTCDIWTAVLSMLVEDRTLWVATFRQGIKKVDLDSGEVRSYLSDPADPSSRVFVLFRSANGRIWAGTSVGLYYYDRRRDCFVRQFPIQRVSAITEDRQGRLWIATTGNGLYAYDVRTGNLDAYLHDRENPRSLSHNSITSLAVDDADRLWIGTAGAGLCRYDAASDSFVSYSSRKFRFIKQLFADGSRMWISTSAGISSFSPDDGAMKHYPYPKGVRDDRFNINSCIWSSDGKIVFVMSDGICFFSVPRDTGHDEVVYPPIIKRFSVNGIPMYPAAVSGDDSPLTLPIERTEKITLRQSRNRIEFRFVSPNYLAPDNYCYRYMLDGFDRQWIETDNRNAYAHYSNLPAGRYRLRLQVCDDDLWQDSVEAGLDVEIQPPVLLSKVAVAVYILVAILALATGAWLLKRQYDRRTQRKIAMLRRKNEKEFYEQRVAFFTGIAHEIKTPLSLIAGPVEELMKSDHLTEDESRYLSLIRQNSQRLSSLVRQLLDFRKIDTSSYRLHYDVCDFAGLVSSQIRLFLQSAYGKSVSVTEDIPSEGLTLVSDREALTKIVSNLLSNAMRFAEHEVQVRLLLRDGGALLEVQDDGPGIPPEEREKIFRPFYQARNNRTGTGIGIGLNLCRTLVDLLNGSIRADGRHDGRSGAVFTVFVPDSSDRLAAADRSPMEAGKPASGTDDLNDTSSGKSGVQKKPRPYTIMVVDDEEELLEFVAKVLDKDYSVIRATGGIQALELLKRSLPDVIVSDVMMADIDGMELCRRIRGNMETSHIPVILLTARTGETSRIEGFECGADAYIEKPFSPDYLRKQIASILYKRDEIRRHYDRSDTGIRIRTHNRLDEEFIEKCREIVLAHISDPDLSVDFLVRELGMSRTATFKKLKSISGMTPNDFMKHVRLKEAMRLMVEGKYSITEIGYITGFSSSSYFAKCFAQEFKILPTEFVRRLEEAAPDQGGNVSQHSGENAGTGPARA